MATITPGQQNTNQLYSDLQDAFGLHPMTDDVQLVTGASDIVQSVMNLVQLNHYESWFHPEIGGNVYKLLFELADGATAQSISTEITNVLTNFEPRVEVISVDVENDIGANGWDVTITFQIISSPAPLTINFFLQRIR